MKKPVISIIIPVYNMERYLKQCIESIRQQTFKDWECIIVNDGSFDTTPTIIREETRGDARFKIINKENGGLSSARNVALKLAQGEYIGFIDSDDWIEPNMYEHLYNLITEHNADIAQVAYLKEYANGIIEGAPQEPIRVIDGLTAMVEMGYGKIPRFVWNKLHRKEIIDSDFLWEEILKITTSTANGLRMSGKWSLTPLRCIITVCAAAVSKIFSRQKTNMITSCLVSTG